MNIVTIIQARLRSTRRPWKILEDLNGKTMLERVVERSEQIGYPVVVAIPDDEPELDTFCAQFGWTVFHGPHEDVLKRYLLAAQVHNADHVIRVTSDCPLLDPEAARYTLRHHLETEADFTQYIAEGRAVQVFTYDALFTSDQAAWEVLRDSPDRWILAHNPPLYKIETVRFSVDTEEDIDRIRRWIGGEEAETGLRSPLQGGGSLGAGERSA